MWEVTNYLSGPSAPAGIKGGYELLSCSLSSPSPSPEPAHFVLLSIQHPHQATFPHIHHYTTDVTDVHTSSPCLFYISMFQPYVTFGTVLSVPTSLSWPRVLWQHLKTTKKLTKVLYKEKSRTLLWSIVLKQKVLMWREWKPWVKRKDLILVCLQLPFFGNSTSNDLCERVVCIKGEVCFFAQSARSQGSLWSSAIVNGDMMNSYAREWSSSLMSSLAEHNGGAQAQSRKTLFFK